MSDFWVLLEKAVIFYATTTSQYGWVKFFVCLISINSPTCFARRGVMLKYLISWMNTWQTLLWSLLMTQYIRGKKPLDLIAVLSTNVKGPTLKFCILHFSLLITDLQNSKFQSQYEERYPSPTGSLSFMQSKTCQPSPYTTDVQTSSVQVSSLNKNRNGSRLNI